jgi:flagellar biosynthesis protein FlhB
MNRFAEITAEKFRIASSLYTIKMVNDAKARGEIKHSIDTEKAAYLIDTYITIFSYSMVSEYQKIRFNSFFTSYEGDISTEEMIHLVVETIKQIFQN